MFHPDLWFSAQRCDSHQKTGSVLNILWFHMCFSIAQSPVRFCCNSSWGILGWTGQNAVNGELPVDGENSTKNSQLEAVFDVNLKNYARMASTSRHWCKLFGIKGGWQFTLSSVMPLYITSVLFHTYKRLGAAFTLVDSGNILEWSSRWLS